VDLILADNQHVLDHLSEKFGFDRSQMLPYFPLARIEKPVLRPRTSEGLKILWAGRFTRQKRPDVLARVAEHCPEHEFDVFCTNPDSREASDYLGRLYHLPNLKFHGAYGSFEELAGRGYDAFLYTSGWDGMPNVILEAVASGIPVIAPDVGGISEMIREETGYLVSGPDAVEEFVAYVQAIFSDPAGARLKAVLAQEQLLASRTRRAFLSAWSSVLDRWAPAQASPAIGVPLDA
jgi:glycosyltransferase involved in cell wall biosynthesis